MAPKTTASGSGLNRKLGPLPLKIWLLVGIALVVGYVFLRHPSITSAATNAGDSASQLPGSTSDSTGSQGSPSDAATADLLAALGNDNQQLLQTLLSQSQLFYGGGASFVPGSSQSSLDAGGSGVTAQLAALTGLSSSTNGVPLNQAGYPENSSYTSLGLPAPTAPVTGPNYGAPSTQFTVFGPNTPGQPSTATSTNTGTRNIAV